MTTYVRSWWWVKEKKQMALVLITITMMLQFQIKGCVGCVESERIGLLELKSYFNSLLRPEDEHISKLWSRDDPMSDCCHWEGVNCSATIGGHVVDLILQALFIPSDASRSLNLSLFHSFPQLQSLVFSGNGFSNLFDPIHGYKSFQRLEKLRTLDLSFNGFNNSVLSFLSAARSLRTLDLRFNRLEGVFPPEVFKDMPMLQELDLRYNGLTHLGVLMFPSSLQVLNLRQTQLSLSPKDYSKICRLVNLREIDLSGNALTSMPYCLSNLTHLRALELSDNQMNGDLTSFVSSLPSSLEYLSLLYNNFNVSFSFNCLANHTRLEVFKLSSKVGVIRPRDRRPWVPLFQLKILALQNFILGNTFPSFIVHQHDLRIVDLSNNNLTGAFPTWLVHNNTRLQTLLLNSNSLTKLQLPRLAHGLEVLDISSNRISESVQEDIGIIFPNLRSMNFASNHFQGGIPSSMGKMVSLKTLDMSSNDLSGKLPTTFLSSCYSLLFLKLSNNRFEGEIFPEHANLTSLEWLALDGNIFNGSLGKGLLNSNKLSVLDISNNSISGTLPPWLSGMSNLGFLYVRRNQLKGLFPLEIRNLQLLEVIDISHNSFFGSIPKTIEFPVVRELRLQSNKFMGTIPDILFKGKSFEVLDLRNNNFSGQIPNTIGNTYLSVLLLGNNGLQSHIPESICQLSNINLMDLSHNQFEGVIPSCFSNMSFGAEETYVSSLYSFLNWQVLQHWKYTSAIDFSLMNNFHSIPRNGVEFLTKNRYDTYQDYMCGLDLSSNQLSGEIPVELGDLQNILSINLSNNRLTGSIPDSLSKLKELESLDLSNNKLHGRIPSQLADLNNIGFLNISCNNLSGEIPINGHLLTFDENSYVGNAFLCGPPTKKICSSTRVSEPSVAKHAEEEESDGVIDMVGFYWTCGGVYISTALASFLFLCIDSSWSREWFYHVDLMVHHLHDFKDRFACN